MWGALVLGLATLAGSYLSQENTNRSNRQMQDSANNANITSAREQMAFQGGMSNTAHQREVKDMRAAGLNPMLSGMNSQGASTPQGAAGQSGAAKNENPLAEALKMGTSSALETRRLKKELDATDSSISLNRASEDAAKAKATADRSTALRQHAESKILAAQYPSVAARSKFEQKKYGLDTDLVETDAILNRVETATGSIGNLGGLIRSNRRSGDFKRAHELEAMQKRRKNSQMIINKNTGEILEE